MNTMVYKTITMIYNRQQDDLQWFTINCKMIYNDLQNDYHDLQWFTINCKMIYNGLQNDYNGLQSTAR
jgi:hypothetical protein